MSAQTGVRPTNFGTAVFELRMERGLTQRELSKLSGLQPSAISDIENLRRPPPPEKRVAALSRALSVEVEQGQFLQSLARAERRATHGLRISRSTPRRVAQLMRDIALCADRLTDKHVNALQARLREMRP